MAAASTHHNLYILRNLVEKDFKVRYRNMSLGILWSLVNPLIMMTVLTFVFTVLMPSGRENFALFLLMGLLPFNFFSMAWSTGTNSIADSGSLLKKIPFRRELVPISVVLGNLVHFLIQLALLLVAAAWILGANRHWVWLPLIVLLLVVFVSGATLMSSALDVYFRDVRYIVESSNLVLFWLSPIFYGLDLIGPRYNWLYEMNPIAAVIVITRRVLLYGEAPGPTIWKLAAVSLLILGLGHLVFSRIQKNFTDYM